MLKILRCVCAAAIAVCLAPAGLSAEADEILALNGILLQEISRKDTSTRAATADIAGRRAGMLRSAIRRDPAKALSLMLTAEQAAQVRDSGMAPQDSIERTDSYSGPVEVTVWDDFDRSRSVQEYRFRINGRSIRAFENGEASPNAGCGDSLRLSGVRVGDVMAVTKVKIVARQAAGEGCSATGPQRTAVILAGSPENPFRGLSNTEVADLVFGTSGQTARTWYDEHSYGKTSLSGDVFGPFVLDKDYACDDPDLPAAAIRSADADINFRDYNRIVLVYPASLGCTAGGYGDIGCKELRSADGTTRATFSWIRSRSNRADVLATVVHELGHNLGVGHARTLRYANETLGPDTATAAVEEYGDPTSAMGEATALGSFGAAHKLELTWLAAGDVASTEIDGQFRIAPIGSSSGVRALRVRRKVGSNEWLWVEFRQPSPNFGDLTTPPLRGAFEGALIRRETPEFPLRTHLLDFSPPSIDETRLDPAPGLFLDAVLKPGKVWRDPHSDLTLEVLSVGPDGLQLSVRYDVRCSVVNSTGLLIPHGGQSLTLPVNAPGCPWQVSSARPWLEVTPGAATVVVKASANPTKLGRIGSFTVGRRVLPVLQPGAPDPTRILSTSPKSGAIANDTWSAYDVRLQDDNGIETLKFIEISMNTSPSAAGGCLFRYNVAEDIAEISEDGGATFHPGDSDHFVTAGRCAFDFPRLEFWSKTEASFGFLLGSGSAAAAPVAQQLSLRIEDIYGNKGNGWLTAAEYTHGPECRAMPLLSSLDFPASGGQTWVGIWTTEETCAWTAISQEPWIRVTTAAGTSVERLYFSIQENTGATTRTGRITVGGQAITIKQFGAGQLPAGGVTLRPAAATVSSGSGTEVVSFSLSVAGANVEAVSTTNWLDVIEVSTSGSQREVVYAFEENLSAAPRQGVLQIGDASFVVTQLGANLTLPRIEELGVVNGASFQPFIAPNAWFSIRANRLAPQTRSWTADDFVGGRLPTALDGVSVSVNGKPAYIYYISPEQINALAPSGTGLGLIPVEVNNNGRKSIYNVALHAPVSPALFQVPVADKKFAAAVAVNGTLLVPEGSFPGATTRAARRGETISLYATGLGITEPEYVEGTLNSEPLPLRVIPGVTVGGRAARVTFAGLVSPGLFQINVEIPDTVEPGNLSVRVQASGFRSPMDVVIPVE